MESGVTLGNSKVDGLWITLNYPEVPPAAPTLLLVRDRREQGALAD